MLSTAIFQPEITTPESQVAQLQAQIVAAQERITHLIKEGAGSRE